MRAKIRFFWMIFGVFALARAAWGQGWIVPELPERVGVSTPLYLTGSNVQISVEDQVATFRIDQTFQNRSPVTVEGTFYFPLPAGSQVTEFSIYQDGKKLKGEILTKEEALSIYESIVRKYKDPALLEYVEKNLFRARIFPVMPGRKVRVKLRYVQKVRRLGDLYELKLPLGPRGAILGMGEKDGSGQMAFAAEITSQRNVEQVYSPSRGMEIVRKGPGRVLVSFEVPLRSLKENEFRLYYRLGRDPIGLSSFTFRRPGEDGYFLLVFSPSFTAKRRIPKDLVFVLDVSGSMAGQKIEQARNALKFCLRSLKEDDRFNIIAFSSTVRRYAENLQPARSTEVDSAIRFLDQLSASGGTNIHDALMEALHSTPQKGRFFGVVFLTDGQPTVGVTEDREIISAVEEKNRSNLRIFAFGVGFQVNTYLLDQIASITRGVAEYVTPEENIEMVVSSFFRKVSEPLLSNLRVKIEGLEVYDIFPEEAGDLFEGSEVIIAGRYKTGGSAGVRLIGVQGEEKRVFSADVDFARENLEFEFVPPLWAARKIGFLLDEIRKNGENDELVDEIVQLSREFGIVTPYTSYLVREEEKYLSQRWPGGYRPQPSYQVRALIRDSQALSYAAPGGKTGEAAVRMSEAITSLKGAQHLELAASMAVVRRVRGRSFVYEDGVWREQGLPDGAPVIRVVFASQAYFALLRVFPELRDFLRLGDRVLFLWRGKIVEIGTIGKAKWSKKEILKTFPSG